MFGRAFRKTRHLGLDSEDVMGGCNGGGGGGGRRGEVRGADEPMNHEERLIKFPPFIHHKRIRSSPPSPSPHIPITLHPIPLPSPPSHPGSLRRWWRGGVVSRTHVKVSPLFLPVMVSPSSLTH